MAACFCTLAVHAPYRKRARMLCSDPAPFPWVVLTDEPADFVDLPVRAIRHAPTGPMAVDYLTRLDPTGNGRGAAAYHDKRFVLRAALQDFGTAIFLDADSRIDPGTSIGFFPPGLAVAPVVRNSIAGHLESCGAWRLPAFVELASDLLGGADTLHEARWCHETCFAVTRDGNEDRFLAAWDYAAGFMQCRGVYSGEGGVIGVAAAYAAWTVDYDAVAAFARAVRHEGGGPKET
jgi:hypothetical protein